MNSIQNNSESLSALKAEEIILGPVSSFRALALAQSSAYRHHVEPARIVMGDYPFYWVVSPADAERLVGAGYELIG